MIRKHCAINAEGKKLLENAVTRLGLSARAHDRILKVSRTIADLDASTNIETKRLSEAIPDAGPKLLGLASGEYPPESCRQPAIIATARTPGIEDCCVARIAPASLLARAVPGPVAV